jgi:hypothetical protein
MNEKIEPGTLDRVHNARHQISEKFNHEPEKLIRYYMELQKNYKNRLADRSENSECKPQLA